MTVPDPRAVVLEHVAAFNAHDSKRLLAGFAPGAVWATGADMFRTTDELTTLFDPWLWTLEPSLDVRTLLVSGAAAAAELREELIVDGKRRSFDIGVFFVVEDGLIVRAKVYREGSADLDGSRT
ncbi:MAG: nuclear transport factor 2 family protein [Actinomycetota bacterium]|nr:nuclear transport factor 2 family protein [Actinomycetota bacterium]